MTGPPLHSFDQPFVPSPEDEGEVNRLLRDGRLRRMFGPVLVAADLPETSSLRGRAIGLLVPPALLAGGAVVGFGTAAWLLAGWSPLGPPGGPPPGVVDLVLPPSVRQRVVDPRLRLRQMRLVGRHVGPLAGLPVTTPARTVADLARDLPPARSYAALVAVREATGVQVPEVLRCLDEMPRARGCAHARLVVASWLGQSSERLPVIR